MNLASNSYDIPIVINNRNRLTTLMAQINWFSSAGHREIYILDNDSTYPPLLQFYDSLQARLPLVRVIYLKKNIGYLALWESSFAAHLAGRYFAYTDSDVVPDETCPQDLVAKALGCLEIFPFIEKVGVSLRIDDLPEHFSLRTEVIRHEAQFWQKSLSPMLFEAPVDTTFAVYRPYTQGGYWLPAARLKPPYVARHLPWYVDLSHLDEEEAYYRENAKGSTHWTKLS